MKIIAISFGSDWLYTRMAKVMLLRLKRNYNYIDTKIFTANDLDSDLLNYAVLHKRGFGYWIWKPYIVKKSIDKLCDGDILLYIDARSGIPESRISWLDNLIKENQTDFVAWQLVTPEQSRTTADLLSLMNIKIDSSIATSGQFAATFFALRVGPLTRKIVSSWYDIIKENNFFCRDEETFLSNHSSFVQNRYDQSVLSILLKKYELIGLRIYRIPESDMFGSKSVGQHNKKIHEAKSIYPWASPHPLMHVYRIFNKIQDILKKLKDLIK